MSMYVSTINVKVHKYKKSKKAVYNCTLTIDNVITLMLL